MTNTANDHIVVKDIDGQLLTATLYTKGGNVAADYTNYFFIAPCKCIVIKSVERHIAAGTAGGTTTLQIQKIPSGTATQSGTNLFATPHDLMGTADTNNTAVLSTTRSDLILNAGDALQGTATASIGLTGITGVGVTVTLRKIGGMPG